jgi:hypothetical protein
MAEETYFLKVCIGVRDVRSSLPTRSRKMARKVEAEVKSDNPDEFSKTKLLSETKKLPNMELYVKNGSDRCTRDNVDDSMAMIVSVTFYCEPGSYYVNREDTFHSDTVEEYYPPFAMRKLAVKPCEFNIKIQLRDLSVHFFKQSFDLIHYDESIVECPFDPSNIPPEVSSSPLPSIKFYIEFDLLVPYPFNLKKASSPQYIAEFIENVSGRPCQFVGYYLDEPLEGQSESEKLLYHISWKLALVSVPLCADRVALPHVLKLKSPAVKGTAGLDGLSRVVAAIESAFDELKVLRRPGFRLGLDVSHFDFGQIKNIARQYFKYYDVIEDLVKVFEDVEPSFPFTEHARYKVYINAKDIITQRIDARHDFSMVGNYLGEHNDITRLIDKASCIEELIEFACPISTRSYRFTMYTVTTRGHLEFRFEMPDLDFHPMSCVIGVLCRFVARAALLPAPKRFSKQGQGRNLSMRKIKCFKWLVKDRYLEKYFNIMNSLHDAEPNDVTPLPQEEEKYEEKRKEDEESVCSSTGSSKVAATCSISNTVPSSAIDPLVSQQVHISFNESCSNSRPPDSLKPSSRSVRVKKTVSCI